MKKSTSLLFVISFLSLPFASAATLSLDGYLSQVENQSQELGAAKQTAEGATLVSGEASLMYVPHLVASTQWYATHFTNATFPSAYKSLETDSYTFGFQEQTPFGLNANLSYLLSRNAYLGGIDVTSGTLTDRKFWEGTPKLDLSLSLWRNFFGSETKATETLTKSSALANEYSSRYQVKATRAQAESAYVRLVSAQQLVRLYEDSVSHAKDILNWNNRRTARNLGESSDVLQAQANLEAQNLALQSSQDETRTSAREFNRLRNVDSDVVEETLELPSISNIQAPARAELRDDVRAAQEASRVAAAQAKLGLERNQPTLEAFGSFALNQRQSTASQTFSNSFELGQQTTAWGFRFNMPLAFGTEADVRKGYSLEQSAAESLVAQKLFNQEVEWKDLSQQLLEAQKRYEIAERLAKIQKKKVENERVRLKEGRTTTYQTLIFNIDFNTAEVARIQAQSNVLNLLARMKTFGDSKL